MPKADPRFSHLSQDAREEVFEHLNKAMTELATYIPSARQNPYWKARVVNGVWRKWERWAFMNGWSNDYYFPEIEKCFDSAVEELGILAQVALLDPRLQIEAVPVGPDVPEEGDGCPSWAFPVHRYHWIEEFVEVRPETTVFLVLFQPDIVHLPREEVMEDLRHELGHAFLYLRDPEAKDDCAAADEEWKDALKIRSFH